jgi:hypothetical protein
MFASRLDNLKTYVAGIFIHMDSTLANELSAAISKTLAMTMGAQLGFIFLNAESNRQGSKEPSLAELKPMLLAGI